MDVRGKKLLILGGTSLATTTVEKAKEMGVYTIVTDYLEDSPAKKVSDESYMVSAIDVDAVVELCKKIKVDGVLTTYNDLLLPYAQEICKKLNFPFIANAEQLEKIGNKRISKELCIKHNIPVPMNYKIDKNFLGVDGNNINYPVLTKPVDSSGQKGISICNDFQELKQGYSEALRFSKSKEVIVEDYLSGDYVVICMTLQNGYLSLSAMADKPVIPEEYSRGLVKLPKGYVLPSKYIDLFYNTVFDNFKALSNDLGLKNGSWGVEAIVKDGKFFVFEMQYRLGGIKHQDFVLKENSIDLMNMHIRYALTGEFSGWSVKELDNPYFKKTYCLLNVILKPGTINKILGPNEVLDIPEVIDYLQFHEIGDKIEFTGSTMQIFAKISIEVSSKENLIDTIKSIYKKLKVLDEKNESMLLESIKIEELK